MYDYQHAFLDMPLGADGLQKQQQQQEQQEPAAVLRFTRDLKVLRFLQVGKAVSHRSCESRQIISHIVSKSSHCAVIRATL